MFKKISIIMILTVLFGLSMAISTSASEPDECINCHLYYAQTTADPTKFILPRLNDGSVSWTTLNKTVCKKCHWTDIGIQHYPRFTTVIVSVYGTVYGGFKSTSSIYTGAGMVHNLHNGPKRSVGSTCIRCHGVVSCMTCHDSVPHNQHYKGTGINPNTGLTITTPILTVVNGSARTQVATTCAASECHKKLPSPVRKQPDGTDLCYNCHRTAGVNGHVPAKLDPAHASRTVSLKIGSIDYIVSCDGCHASPLSAEHKNVAVRKNLPNGTECGYCHGSSAPAGVKSVVTDIKTVNASTTDPTIEAGNRACTKCHFNLLLFPDRAGEHVTWHIATLSNNLKVVGGPHQNCNTCHANSNLVSITATLARTPIASRNYDCFVCHNAQNNLAPIHKATFDGELTEITDLHGGCGTCHTPGTEFANKVRQIITGLKNGAQSYDCVDCHTGATLDAGHTGIIDVKCQSCHKVALTQEHLSNPITQVNNQANPLTCGTCHQSTNVKVRLAINTRNTNCAACHDQAHSFGIAQQVPADIPLYPGFEWSVSQPAEVWANETWMPAGYEGAQLIISNRRTGVTGPQIWDYYSQNMTVNGWVYTGIEWAVTEVEPVTETNFFTAEFTKNKRKVTVFFYGGENHSPTPVVSSGYRLEILYK